MWYPRTRVWHCEPWETILVGEGLAAQIPNLLWRHAGGPPVELVHAILRKVANPSNRSRGPGGHLVHTPALQIHLVGCLAMILPPSSGPSCLSQKLQTPAPSLTLPGDCPAIGTSWLLEAAPVEATATNA